MTTPKNKYKTNRLAHLVPDFSFENDDDDFILKMTQLETKEQIVRNNLAMKRLVEFNAKLYCRTLAIQNDKLKATNMMLESHLSEMKKEHSSMMVLSSCYSRAVDSLKDNLNAAVHTFDEQSTPIINKDIYADEEGYLHHAPPKRKKEDCKTPDNDKKHSEEETEKEKELAKEVQNKEKKKDKTTVAHLHDFEEDDDSHTTLNEKPMQTIVFQEKLTKDDLTSVGDSLTVTPTRVLTVNNQKGKLCVSGEKEQGKGVADAIKEEETTSSSDDDRND